MLKVFPKPELDMFLSLLLLQLDSEGIADDSFVYSSRMRCAAWCSLLVIEGRDCGTGNKVGMVSNIQPHLLFIL